MAKWMRDFSWENLFDGIAAKSPDFVKIIVVTGKSFLYYHGLTRAAALTYTTILAVIPLLILLTSITLAVGFGNFISDYLPHLLDMFSLDWPTEPIVALIENAEHVPIGKLGIIGAAGLFVTFILAFGSLESNFNVVWENKTSRTLWKQTCIYTPFLLILAGFIGLYAGFVNHVQEILSTIIIDGFHFSHSFLTLIINAFWYVTFHVILLLFIFMMLYALPSRPDKKGVYTKRKLYWTSVLATFLAWLSIFIYVKILMLIQTAMVNRMSIFYGSLAFIPLLLFLLFGIWVIILCGNSLVWTICHWPEAGKKTWNWQGGSKDL
ncbi:MAG: YihY/virulence factor BrkB family protein [Fibrobacter sp.]|jgi:membrane protein|uniref:YihY/virulence factor BrkB family protein n=1 Tax=uncultured Fibrobacter sp. TaxID=261512 RepID=UPI0025D78684|nr:YhjD/YihY/BrkB family envelope integrity protein [uncultured Fibrobacter sp.]MBO4713245.1 YihY/virulence factor BrkB family protein [Fibrobacter sp.]